MNTTNSYAIVTCVTPSWLAPALVMMLSVSKQLHGERADLFIFCNGLNEHNHDTVEEFVNRHCLKVELRSLATENFEHLDPGRYSGATFLRLCLDEELPETYDRVLYLDSDILALTPLGPLLAADLGDMALGAVPEVKLTSGRGILTDRHRRKIGLKRQTEYFNAGMLLFDWKKTLAKGLLKQARDIILSDRQFKYLDQDVLNLAFAGLWRELPLKWNTEQSAIGYLDVLPALRHFNSAAKPWDWTTVLGYEPHHAFYVEALHGLALEAFLRKKKTGNPHFANFQIFWQRSSWKTRRQLRKRFVSLL